MDRDAASRKKTSEIAMGRILLFGLENGSERKARRRERAGSGKAPATMSEMMSSMAELQDALGRRDRSNSAVQPEGPGAEPEQDLRMRR